jgi:hypothetical protein
MHAQLQQGLGCMPIWFNEGIAAYFADRVYASEWIAMMRTSSAIDFKLLSRSTFGDTVRSDNVSEYYAQSLAMVLLARERSGNDLGNLVQRFRVTATADETARLQFWPRAFGDVDGRAFLDSLARRFFGASSSIALQPSLKGVVCCSGLARVDELKCHVPTRAPDGGTRGWLYDDSVTPAAACRGNGWAK